METLQPAVMTLEEFNIISDVFSQAITGELIGMSNFASLAETIDDPHEKMEAVEHANSERMHAEGFMAYAKKNKLKININMQSPYWGNVRSQFLSYAQKKDFIACLKDEPMAKKHFESLTGSHQRYFSKWIDSAKTEETKVKRITMAVNALAKKWGYPEMLRSSQGKPI